MAEYERSMVKYIRGYPFPDLPFYAIENISSVFDHTPEDGDIVLCSYPKTGSTWMQYIVWQIIHNAESYPPFDEMVNYLVPVIPITGIAPLEILTKPRAYKTHFPFHMLKINKNAKYIYTYRNPRDVVVSYYHMINNVGYGKIEFHDYFEKFIVGEVPYGDYFDHFWSFYRHAGEPNLLFVPYEDLKANPREEYWRIAKFLGEEYFDRLTRDAELMNKILEVTSFDYMKKTLSATVFVSNNFMKNFFRKGIVGDGKSLISAEQNQKLQRVIKLKMNGTKFADIWCL